MIRELKKTFETDQGILIALDDVSLHLEKGRIGGLIGRSGSGKTTLFRCLSGLETTDSGSVIIHNTTLSHLSPEEHRLLLQKIGIVFQHFNLLRSRTVFENVSLPLELRGHSKDIIEERVTKILTLVGLVQRAHHYPSELSGGQKQRVAIARALVDDVDLLLCDEFTSALDPETSLEILELLREINRTLGVTIFLISHDMDVIREICDDVFVLDQGRIIESGSLSTVYLSPQTDVTKRLFRTQVDRDLPHTITSTLQQEAPHAAPSKIIMRLVFSEQSAQLPLISILSREFTLDLSIIAGHLDHIREKAYGSLLISFDYEPKTTERVLDFFKLHHVYAEALGYIPQ